MTHVASFIHKYKNLLSLQSAQQTSATSTSSIAKSSTMNPVNSSSATTALTTTSATTLTASASTSASTKNLLKNQCYVCGVVCSSSSSLNNHKKTSHQEIVQRCFFCNAESTTLAGAAAHVSRCYTGGKKDVSGGIFCDLCYQQTAVGNGDNNASEKHRDHYETHLEQKKECGDSGMLIVKRAEPGKSTGDFTKWEALVRCWASLLTSGHRQVAFLCDHRICGGQHHCPFFAMDPYTLNYHIETWHDDSLVDAAKLYTNTVELLDVFAKVSSGCVVYGIRSPTSLTVVVEQKSETIAADPWSDALLMFNGFFSQGHVTSATVVLFRENGGNGGVAGELRRNRLIRYVTMRENVSGLSTVFMFTSANGLAVAANNIMIVQGCGPVKLPRCARKQKKKKARIGDIADE